MEHMPAHDIDSTPADDEAPEATPADDTATEAPREVRATVTRQARMGRFLILGAIVGVLVTLVLAMLWPDDPGFVPADPTLQFSDLQVFGFLAIYIVPICMGIAGLVGYLLGVAAAKRHAREITMERVED